MLKFQSARECDLQLVAPAPPPDEPPLIVGDRCFLNSGSSSMLVVACDSQLVTVSIDGAAEYALPRECVRRTI